MGNKKEHDGAPPPPRSFYLAGKKVTEVFLPRCVLRMSNGEVVTRPLIVTDLSIYVRAVQFFAMHVNVGLSLSPQTASRPAAYV